MFDRIGDDVPIKRLTVPSSTCRIQPTIDLHSPWKSPPSNLDSCSGNRLCNSSVNSRITLKSRDCVRLVELGDNHFRQVFEQPANQWMRTGRLLGDWGVSKHGLISSIGTQLAGVTESPHLHTYGNAGLYRLGPGQSGLDPFQCIWCPSVASVTYRFVLLETLLS